MDIYTVFQAFVDSWDGISADLSRLSISEGWRGKLRYLDLIKKLFSADLEEM